ncbi:MAG: CvpA family protein [Desulfobacteraceae bacterium]|nr:CvpA family protein [Desulfobacteraceae bacterium]
MNLLDIALLVILGFFLIRGIFRGLVKELSSIIGVFSGFFAAYRFYPQVAQHLARWVPNGSYANIISCLLLFIGVYLVVSLIGMLIKYLMNIVFLGWTDRLCGLVFGAIKGALIVSAIVIMLTTFLPKNSAMLKGSMVVKYTQGLNTLLVRGACTDLEKRYHAHLEELKQTWHNPQK